MTKRLTEAARQVVYFGGPTPDNLKELTEALDEVDNDERSHPDEDEDEDDYGPLEVDDDTPF